MSAVENPSMSSDMRKIRQEVVDRRRGAERRAMIAKFMAAALAVVGAFSVVVLIGMVLNA